MARYHGPKARINRRLGFQVYESHGAIKAMERRDNPPGMHTRPRRPSNYGLALKEKQKIKHYYGLGERQLRRFFDSVRHKKGNTGEQMMLLLERRLDNVVRRAGFVRTRPQARQGIVHGHFRVNGVKVSSPSYLIRAGDVITIKTKEPLENLYRGVIANSDTTHPADWLGVDVEGLRINVSGLPGPSDLSLPVDVNIVVEFMSR
jgi:small subunit ribosomal protein S4